MREMKTVIAAALAKNSIFLPIFYNFIWVLVGFSSKFSSSGLLIMYVASPTQHTMARHSPDTMKLCENKKQLGFC